MVDIRRLPIIGNDIYNVGQVVDVIAQACTPVPSIAVQAFFANIPMLIWSLAKPDPIDYVSERFGRHHKRNRKNRIVVQAVDQPDSSPTKGMQIAVFSGLKLLERVGWYFLVIDATSDFLVNWSSMAYRYSGCQEPFSGYASTRDDNGFEYFSSGAPNTCGGGSFSFTAGYTASNSTVRKLLPGARSVSAGIAFNTPPNTPHGTVQRVYIREAQGVVTNLYDVDISAAAYNGDRSGSLARRGYNTLEPPATYDLVVEATAGWVDITNWHLELSGWNQAFPGIEADP